MNYELDSVPESGEFSFAEGGFERASFQPRELQPATRVRLLDSPTSHIRVRAQGDPAAVAPGILAQVESLAGTSPRYELVG